jgi:predicted N-acetyltransferase YhbS
MSHSPIQYRKATPPDFDGILHLQHQNLITTLQEKDLSQGFLIIEFNREQLYKINGELGIFVAVQDKEVIGYLMAESVDFAVGSPLIAHMFSRLKGFVFDDVPLSSCKWFLYGPVCIDKQYRGQKILDGLFKVMLKTLKGQYDVGVAFVSVINPRSFNAHKNKLGMRIADEFEFNGQHYWTLIFTVEQKERK